MTKSRSRRHDPATLTYRIAEVAQILGISASTVRRRIQEGTIPIVGGLGKLKRIPRSWVDQAIGRRSGLPE